MASGASGGTDLLSDQCELLKQVLSTVQSIRQDHQNLSAAVERIERSQGRPNIPSEVKQLHDGTRGTHLLQTRNSPTLSPAIEAYQVADDAEIGTDARKPSLDLDSAGPSGIQLDEDLLSGRKFGAASISRIILTTYPGQSGIDPLVMNWGHMDALKRGPVVVSRVQSTVKRRNGKQDRNFPSAVSLTSV